MLLPHTKHRRIRSQVPRNARWQVQFRKGISQPIQWSSEYHDTELALVYYNYRYYNLINGRWLTRDIANKNDYVYCNNSPCYEVDPTGLNSIKVGNIPELNLEAHVEVNGSKGQSSMHIHIGKDKYDYRNDRDIPGFYNRKTGQPLPNSVKKKLSDHKNWKRILDKANRTVEANGVLSVKFGGGKVIRGCVSIVAILESTNMLNSYVDALKTGNIRKMNQAFNDFMNNLPDHGTIVRACIFEDAYRFHEEMKSFAQENMRKE